MTINLIFLIVCQINNCIFYNITLNKKKKLLKTCSDSHFGYTIMILLLIDSIHLHNILNFYLFFLL